MLTCANCTTGATTFKTSGSVTTSNSTTGKLSTGSSGFMASSTGSVGTNGGFDEGGFLEGQILEAPNLRTFTFLELRTATKNFRPDSVLGEGGFGRVYKGWVDEKTMNPAKSGTGMVVAVKKLNSESLQGYEEWQVKSGPSSPSFFVFLELEIPSSQLDEYEHGNLGKLGGLT
jgi:hypothetical protein